MNQRAKQRAGRSAWWTCLLAIELTCRLAGASPPDGNAAAEASKAAPRRPIALVPLGQRLLTSNARSGTISVLDVAARKVVAELPVADRISDMAACPGADDVLVLDDTRHRLLSVRQTEQGCSIRQLVDLPANPVRMLVSQKPNRVFVSSLWARRVTILEFDESFEDCTAAREVPLEFAPRELLLLPGEETLLLAADAFGGRLAVIDPDSGTVRHVLELPAHNIRGLAIAADGRTLLVSHQTLDTQAWTDRESVHWGILMANSLRGVSLQALRDPRHSLQDNGWLERLGLAGRGMGDPGPVLVDALGRRAVALSGVGEVALTGGSYALSLPVGRRPIALAAIDDQLFVANQFDDSVTVVDLRKGEVAATIPLGPSPELSDRDRGELLFFDARLSHDRWMSCHSCHTDGHTSGLNADTLGDGDYGAPKRIPSLLGTFATGPWAWIGGAESLEQQVQKSVRTTMHGRDLSQRQLNDLVAYLTSLKPPPTRFVLDPALRERGRQVFESRGCVDCHVPPLYTSPETYDVQLRDAEGRQRFNPPSLLGLGQRDAFFHDGRVKRLEDVLLKVRHQLDEPLSEPETNALLAFLRGL
jgi:YVTN family beta-propeller protein